MNIDFKDEKNNIDKKEENVEKKNIERNPVICSKSYWIYTGKTNNNI
jgi:hypothetical protein